MVKVNELKDGDVLIYTGEFNSVNWTLGKEYPVFNDRDGKLYIWTDMKNIYFIFDHKQYIESYFSLKEEKEAVKKTGIVHKVKMYVRLKIFPMDGSNARVNEPLLHFFLSFYDYADASSWRDSKEVFIQGWITSDNRRKLIEEISTFFGLGVKEW